MKKVSEAYLMEAKNKGWDLGIKVPNNQVFWMILVWTNNLFGSSKNAN